jgi:hypothetical protein
MAMVVSGMATVYATGSPGTRRREKIVLLMSRAKVAVVVAEVVEVVVEDATIHAAAHHHVEAGAAVVHAAAHLHAGAAHHPAGAAAAAAHHPAGDAAAHRHAVVVERVVVERAKCDREIGNAPVAARMSLPQRMPALSAALLSQVEAAAAEGVTTVEAMIAMTAVAAGTIMMTTIAMMTVVVEIQHCSVGSSLLDTRVTIERGSENIDN